MYGYKQDVVKKWMRGELDVVDTGTWGPWQRFLVPKVVVFRGVSGSAEKSVGRFLDHVRTLRYCDAYQYDKIISLSSSRSSKTKAITQPWTLKNEIISQMEGNIKPSNIWAVDSIFTLFMQAILLGFAEDIHKNSEFYLNSRSLQFSRSVGFVWLIYNLGKSLRRWNFTAWDIKTISQYCIITVG